jgi:acetyl esterase
MAGQRWLRGGQTDASEEPMDRPFRLDPELAAISVMIPRFDLTDPGSARAAEIELAANEPEFADGVQIEDVVVDPPTGVRVPLRVYRPSCGRQPSPALLYVHGGSFIFGGLHTEDERCQLYASRANCVVLQVDYRLAPEHRFPAAFDDVMTALSWLVTNADSLGIDRRRIAIGGNSAGGALAASVALECRGSGAPRLVLQMLINPALDCRGGTPSALRFVDSPVFTASDNRLMWQTYLGDDATPDHRASPSLADDVSGSAPAAFWLAEFDPVRDEGYEYALRLMHAGTSVGILQYPGTFHAFDSYRMTRLGRRALEDQVLALKGAFA